MDKKVGEQNQDKVLKRQIRIKDTLKWYHKMATSKNILQDV